MAMEPHIAAQISLLGNTLDVIGGLYLAYDLLGGENGPLGKIFRIVNYSVLTILVLALPMGLKFALVAGVGLGTALAIHVERIARGKPETVKFLACLGVLRAVSLALASCTHQHYVMALILIPVVLCASIVLPRFHLSPAAIYQSSKRPQLHMKQLIMAAVFGSAAMIVGYLSAGITGDAEHAGAFAFRLGLTFSFAVIFVSSLSPLIEWYADNLPSKSFGYIGAVMFMLGFIVQAIPSLITVLDL